MAARLNPTQDARSRAAIQTTQLCKRLNSFALGEADPQTDRPVLMSDGQVRAALGLLRKTIPDLAVTTISGTGAHGEITYVVRAPPEADSTHQWLQAFATQKPNGKANGHSTETE
jgi:hypothetical protein